MDQRGMADYLRTHHVARLLDSAVEGLLTHRPNDAKQFLALNCLGLDPDSSLSLSDAELGLSLSRFLAAHGASAPAELRRRLASPAHTPPSAAGPVLEPTQLARARDGLLDRSRGPVGVLEGYASSLDLHQSYRRIDVGGRMGEYLHCPHCRRITSDDLATHFAVAHPAVPIPHGSPAECPSMASILRLAYAFAADLLQTPDPNRPGTLRYDGVCALHIYTMETPLYKLANTALRTHDAPQVPSLPSPTTPSCTLSGGRERGREGVAWVAHSRKERTIHWCF